jgi:hypothetical protein
MDFDKLLRTVAKAKTCLAQNKEKSQGKGVKFHSKCKLDESIPRSLTQLLSKYSPKCSPLIKKYQSSIKRTNLVKQLNSILIKKVGIFWKRWVNSLKKKPKTNTVKRCSLISSPPCKQRLIKTKSLRFEKTSKLENCTKSFDNRQKTIQKLESVVCIARKIRKLEIQRMEIAFQLVRKRALGEVFKYCFDKFLKSYLSNYFLHFMHFSNSLPNLSITYSESICITPLPKTNLTWLVTQETSFNLAPNRNTYSPFTLTLPNQSSQLSHNPSLCQSFDLPNLSSLESMNSSFNNKNPLTEDLASSQDSFHFFQGSEDLVEFEENPDANLSDSKQNKNEEFNLIPYKDNPINSRYADFEVRESLPDKSIEKVKLKKNEWKGLTCVPKCFYQFFEDEKNVKVSSKESEEKGQISTCVSLQSNLSQRVKLVGIGYFKHETYLREASFEGLKENLMRSKRNYKGLELLNRIFSMKLRGIFLLF